MTTTEPGGGESFAAAIALADDEGFKTEVAQVRARAALEELPGEREPETRPAWSYIEARVVRNATANLLALKRASRNGGFQSNESSALAMARFWESFAKLKGGQARATALANSAVLFELAGYQANAACLARGLGDIQDEPVELSDFASGFLRRRLVALRVRSDDVSHQPGEDELALLLGERGEEESEALTKLASRSALAAAAQGLRAASRFLLRGDGHDVEAAVELLDLAARGYVELGLIHEANLVSSMQTLVPVMAERSTWAQLREFVEADPRWSRYLKLLARGLGPDPYGAASVSELWPSQIEAISGGLLTDDDSKVVRLPTSAGKTRIAELAMVKTLLEDPEARCIYVAPFRALVTEVERGLFSLFADLGIQVASFTGSYDSDALETALAGGSRVLVVTPEKLDLLSRLDDGLLATARLLVLDEGHLVGDLSRGFRLDLLVSRFKLTNPRLRVLMLSAVVADETLADFAAWLGSSSDDVVELNWRPALQRIAMLDWRGRRATLRYAAEGESRLLAEFVPGVSERRRYRYVHRDTKRVRQPTFPEEGNKAQMAADAAFRFATLGPVLVFCSQTNYVLGVARALATRLDIARHMEEAVPPYFDTADTRALLAAAEWLGDDHEVTRLLRQGIAFHHGQLSNVIRQAVELDFRQRRYQVLIATNTLAQGVNLPLRTVVVHSVWRRDASGNASKVPARDYWNIAGRAGRAGEETEGSILHLVTNDRDARDYTEYVGSSRESNIDSALFTALELLASDRISEDALAEGLDSEILALLVEEVGADKVGALVGEVVDATLGSTQAIRRNRDTAPLRRVIVERARKVRETVSDPSLLPLYSSTGLTFAGCESLRASALEHEDELKDLLTGAQEDSSRFALICLRACEQVEEVAPTADFAGSYPDLLQEWLHGVDINDLRARFGEAAGGPDQLSKLIDDLFGYRLPWGMNGFLRIAAAVLEIGTEALSGDARFLPSLVKHGVPVPPASWAITVGIPSRRLAMDIATAFVHDTDDLTYPAFMSWISNLDPDEFRERFGASGDIIDDLAVAVDRSTPNPLLAEHPDATSFVPAEVSLSGAGRSDRLAVAAAAGAGTALDVVREYGDPLSRNATSLWLEGQRLGYLPRRVAQLLAPEIDSGLIVAATLSSIDPEARRITARLTLG